MPTVRPARARFSSDAAEAPGPLAPDPFEAPERDPDAARVTGASTPPADDIVVEMRGVHKSFGPKHILRGVSLQVPRGKSAVVLGGSGTGKSVLTKHVVGLLQPDKGEVWVLGDRVDLMDKDQLDRKRLRLGYLFQGGALFDSMTVYENMRFFLDRHTSLSRAEKDDLVMESLEDVNLPRQARPVPGRALGRPEKAHRARAHAHPPARTSSSTTSPRPGWTR